MRTIIKEHRFELELRELRGSAKDADTFVETVEWALSRRCPIGTQVATDPPVWFIPMIDEPRIQAVGIYYTFDAHNIIFLHLIPVIQSDN